MIIEVVGKEIEKEAEEYAKNLKARDFIAKPKELLRRCYDNYIYSQPLRGDIEQFLNSEVEK